MKKETDFLGSLFLPLLILLIIWIVFYVDQHFKLNLYQFGLLPRETVGLVGILTMPYLHGDIYHIVSNSFPFLILATLVNYNYTEIAKPVFTWIYLITGLLVWCFADLDNLNNAKNSYHIGASGIVYGLSGFLFFSGIIRKRKDLFAISLLVTFLYGTIVWGIFPEKFQKAIQYIGKQEKVSWEGHLFGFISGTILAFSFRNKGKQKPVYSWEINNDEDIDESNPYWLADDEDEKSTNNYSSQ